MCLPVFGRRGTTANAGSFICCQTASVTDVSSPAAAKSCQLTLPASFLKAHTACWVPVPNWPSTGPGWNPRSVRRCWRRTTSSPLEPLTSVAASGATVGTVVAGSTTVVGGAAESTRTVVVTAVSGPSASGEELPPAELRNPTPSTTTMSPPAARNAMFGRFVASGGVVGVGIKRVSVGVFGCAELVEYNVEQYVRAGCEVGRFGVFRDVVAQPSDTRREDHGGRTKPCQHLCVVSCTTRHSARGVAQFTGGCLDHVDHFGIEVNRIESSERAAFDGDPLGGGDPLDEVVQMPFSLGQRGLVGVAEVDGDRCGGRNDVDQIGLDIDPADGADLGAPHLRGQFANESHDLGGNESGIVTEAHRRRPCMRRLATQEVFGPRDALH